MLRSVKYGLYGAVLAGVVGGTAAWHTVDKTVALDVDGQTTMVHTTAAHVGDILTAAGYHAGPHDIVAPAVTATVHDGSRIVYQRGRLLHLDVNGVRRDIWTTAPTVAAAMTQLGYSTGDFTSVSRATRLPLGATDLTVRTPRMVTIVHDGRTQRVMTTDSTVGQLLDDLGIDVGAMDKLSARESSELTPNQKLIITRLTSGRLTVETALPYDVQRVPTATLPAGQTEIVTPGRNGLARVTYSLVYVNGKLVGKTPISTTVLRAPTTEVIHVGTQTTPLVIPTAGSAQAIGRTLAAQRGWGDAQFNCLVQLWDHESGWRVNAANPSGAYGIPQALPGSKMSAAGADWQTSATTQITWGLDYIASRYGTPCGAWSSWQSQGDWY